jgi:RHS repeat-associated protein
MNTCTYEVARGVKTASSFYVPDTAGTGWTLQRTEAFGYDSSLDILTSADYGDGLANQTVSWTYDAVGNRISDSSNAGTWSFDALNAMTASPGFSYTNDILGNRTAKGSAISYGWDETNRLTSFTNGSTATSYLYRADGMRVAKDDGTNSSAVYYDGQVPIETKDTTATSTVITCNAIGARGIDWMQKTTGSGSVVAFPLYDAHGNMIATLSRSGSGSYSTADLRSYDAWGRIRSGNTTGDPKGRYCGNLGHVEDDESALIYMRARYYEPDSGRFVNEDPGMSGDNWFSYCGNNPTNSADASGKSRDEIERILKIMLGRGMVSKDFFNEFMRRSSGIRDSVHREISKLGLSDEEIMEVIEEHELEYESGFELETPEEMASDISAGEDPGLLLLEEETIIAEAAEEGLE